MLTKTKNLLIKAWLEFQWTGSLVVLPVNHRILINLFLAYISPGQCSWARSFAKMTNIVQIDIRFSDSRTILKLLRQNGRAETYFSMFWLCCVMEWYRILSLWTCDGISSEFRPDFSDVHACVFGVQSRLEWVLQVIYFNFS